MKRKKQQKNQPLRLAWPNRPNVDVSYTATVTNSSSFISHQNNNNHDNNNDFSIYPSIYSSRNKNVAVKQKNRPTTTSASLFTTRKKESDGILFIDKYTPQSSKELCIPSRKVKEVREWIEDSYLDEKSKLLILVGNPGIGKSTMCYILAKEMKLSILQWNDESLGISNNNNHNYSNNIDLELPTRYISPLKSFEEFLSSSGNGFCELDIDYNNNGSTDSDSISIDKESSSLRPLILINDLPYLHTARAQDAFRTMFTNHIKTTKTPIILIHSNVSEGKPASGEIEKLIDPTLPSVCIIKCSQISDRITTKILASILQKERTKFPNHSNFLQQICLSSHGDIRNAINALQIHVSAMKRKKTVSSFLRASSSSSSQNNQNISIYERDTKLFSFHALGKLLYAKRVTREENENSSPSFLTLEKLLHINKNSKISTTNTLQEEHSNKLITTTPIQIQQQRPPLSFNPEEVIQQNDMSNVETSLSFLAYHSPDFFTDIIELSDTFASFSDAALFASRCFDSQRDHGDTIFPHEYLSSITSRAVADANKHPSPNRFRSFTKPPIFDVRRKQKGNTIKIRQLCRRLSIGSNVHLPLQCSISSGMDVVLDYMPFMRTIIPQETHFAIENLYSYAKQDDEDEILPQNEIESLLHLELQEQSQILQEDDIVED